MSGTGLSSVHEIILQPGDLLYCEGEGNKCAYLIESGEVGLFKGHSNEVEFERRGPGAIIGEYSILTGQPRTVTAKAITACRIFEISAREILKKYEQLDPLLRACIDTSIIFSGHTEALVSKVPVAQSAPLQKAARLSNADKVLELLNFEIDIKNGLAADEFFMNFQPIVNILNGQIVGFEALMRWEHKTKGFVPPNQFIAAAEEMNSIGSLTEFALSQSCETLCQLRGLGLSDHLYASVNISGKDIDRDGFPDFLAHVLDRHDLNPTQLKLEITETSLVPNLSKARENLERLRKFGCGVSVDDFGKGYSNFAYLKSLPLTAIKIDRAFIADLQENAVSRSIVRMLVGFGSELGVNIIAEGVECQDAAQSLLELGCRFGQGFHFHKPMPKDDLIALLKSTHVQRSVVA